MPLLGRKFKLKKWFRQLSLADTERWKSWIRINGQYRCDTRAQMGRASAAHNAQRISLILAHAIRTNAVEQQWGLRNETRTNKDSRAARLQDWGNARRAAWPQDLSQASPVYVSVFQDDLVVVAISCYAARATEQGVLKQAREWGLQLSQNPEDTRPFSPNFSALGAAYNLSNPCPPRCVPTAKTVTNLATTVAKLEIMPGRPAPRLEVEKLAGYLCFMARFIAGGTLWCNSIFSALKVYPHTALDSAIVSHQAIEDSQTILAWLGKSEPAPLIRNVVYHFARTLCWLATQAPHAHGAVGERSRWDGWRMARGRPPS